MILIKNTEIQFIPYINLVQNEHLKEPLIEAIKQFIIKNKQRAIINRELVDIFHLSGFNQYNHENLADYLNRYLLRNCHHDLAEVKRGQFSNNPNQHSWILVGANLIIDLSIKKLEQESEQAQNIFNNQYHCFICNNCLDPIYELYHDYK